MKVGVLGTGDVGKALGSAFLALGHEVKMGAREAGNAKAVEWAKGGGARASSGTFADAARFGEIVVLATLGAANEAVIKQAGADAFRGKLLLDTTNPLDFSTGAPRLSVGHTDSGGEQVQRLLPDALVVKVFNTVGNAHMFKPSFPGGPPTMFIAGNDEGAKAKVADMLRNAFGWDVSDLGGIEASRYLEPMCMAWVLHAFKTKQWNHAFKMLHK